MNNMPGYYTNHGICFLCGFSILSEKQVRVLLGLHGIKTDEDSIPPGSCDWADLYRAIRVPFDRYQCASFHYDEHQPFISGTATSKLQSQNRGEAVTPCDPAVSYDLETVNQPGFGYDQEERFQSHTMSHWYGPDESWSTLHNTRLGFQIHEDCWKLFNQVRVTCYPRESKMVPEAVFVRSLFNLCQNFTFAGSASDWADGYGGLRDVRTIGYIHGKPLSVAYLSPLGSFEPKMLQEDSAATKPNGRGARSAVEWKPFSTFGHFQKLPSEIFSAIWQHLPSGDVLSLLSAIGLGRNAVSVLPQQFWRSRFSLGMEMDAIYESVTWPRNIDWRATYFNYRNLPVLQNRRRVYRLARELLNLVYTFNDSIPDGYIGHSPGQQLNIRNWSFWQIVSKIYTKNRTIHQSHISIPRSAERYQLFYVSLAGYRYLSGVSFFPCGTRVGYCLDELETQVINLEKDFDTADGSLLIRMDQLGLRDVRITSRYNWDVKQIWSPDDPDENSHLGCSYAYLPTRPFLIDFDATKMTAIGLEEDAGKEASSYRPLFAWKSSIPPQSILNNLHPEKHVFSSLPHMYKIQFSSNPYAWVAFDEAPKGKYEGRNLNAISVFISDRVQVKGLEFHYDDISKSSSTVLGEETERKSSCLLGSRKGHPVRMEIDGKSGERISKMDVNIVHFHSPGTDRTTTLAAILTIITNFGQKKMFIHEPEPILSSSSILDPANPACIKKKYLEDRNLKSSKTLQPDKGFAIYGITAAYRADRGPGLQDTLWNFGILQRRMTTEELSFENKHQEGKIAATVSQSQDRDGPPNAIQKKDTALDITGLNTNDQQLYPEYPSFLVKDLISIRMYDYIQRELEAGNQSRFSRCTAELWRWIWGRAMVIDDAKRNDAGRFFEINLQHISTDAEYLAKNIIMFVGPGDHLYPLMVSTDIDGNNPEPTAQIEERLRRICELSTLPGAYDNPTTVPFVYALGVTGWEGKLFRYENIPGKRYLEPLEGFDEYKDALGHNGLWKRCFELMQQNTPLPFSQTMST